MSRSLQAYWSVRSGSQNPHDASPDDRGAAIGYDLSDPTAAIVACHWHFRASTAPELDAGDLRILWNPQGKLMRMGQNAPATKTRAPAADVH